MKTVKEVSNLTGVSVRTLHHYDAIGLLKPAKVTDSGYRLYDDSALNRLQSILLFRELKFSLAEIQKILDTPGFDWKEALTQQITLLELQKKKINELIIFAKKLQREGEAVMEFGVFDHQEIEQYKEEVKEKWGNTKAYQEYQQKKGIDVQKNAQEMMQIFSEIGMLTSLSVSDSAVQEKVEMLQRYITEHYYHCTKEILFGLGQMYAADERFKKNIDQAGGEGTAEFVKEAIEIYCKG